MEIFFSRRRNLRPQYIQLWLYVTTTNSRKYNFSPTTFTLTLYLLPLVFFNIYPTFFMAFLGKCLDMARITVPLSSWKSTPMCS